MSATVQRLPGIARTNLQEHDLSIIPEREVVQTRVDVSPGARYVWHKPPGEEVIYVLEGSLEYRIDGESPRVFKAGEALLVRRTRFTR